MERFDGSGHPDGLRGDEIPIAARIITVCDAFDAMVSTQSARGHWMSPTAAVAELRRGAGRQFDPDVVAALERAQVQRRWVAPALAGAASRN